MRRVALLAVLLGLLLLLAACAPAATPAASEGANPAGFWQGLWHGFITLFTFIISLFNHNVGVYEANNNGGWYNFGYLLGIIAFWGGGSGGAARSSTRK